METIFDHNPTDKELKRFGGRESFEFFKSHGIDEFSCADNNWYMIGLLYAGRGNYNKANEYFSKIENKELLSTLMQDF